MQLVHSCYVVALGVLATAFSLGIITLAFGETSIVPMPVVLYLDAAVAPMAGILFASLLYRAFHDRSLWIPDTIADTFVVIMVPIAFALVGTMTAKTTGVALTPLSEKLGLATLGYFFSAALGVALVLIIMGVILIVVQVKVHKLFDD